MKTTIPLSRLASLLASRCEIDPADASNFIKTFFETIEQGLVKDATVSTKDFGTFDVTPEGGVKFTPSEAFSSRVNVAFEAFPIIELDENIEIDSILSDSNVEQSPTDNTAMPGTSITEPFEIETRANHAPEEETATESTTVPTTDTVAETATEHDDDTDTEILIETPVEVSVETPIQIDSPAEPAIPDTPEPSLPAETQIERESAEVKPETSVEYTENTPPAESHINDEAVESMTPEPRRCCTAMWMIIIALIAFLGGIASGYLGRHRIEAFFNSTDPVAADSIEPIPVSVDTATVSEPYVDTSTVAITEQDIALVNDPTTDPEKPAEDTIRYDVISGNRFLTTMAREYYGHQDYWSYIYKENEANLHHPDKIRPGTRVIIPDFEKYRTSTDPEQNRIDARRMGVEIYKRYK